MSHANVPQQFGGSYGLYVLEFVHASPESVSQQFVDDLEVCGDQPVLQFPVTLPSAFEPWLVRVCGQWPLHRRKTLLMRTGGVFSQTAEVLVREVLHRWKEKEGRLLRLREAGQGCPSPGGG